MVIAFIFSCRPIDDLVYPSVNEGATGDSIEADGASGEAFRNGIEPHRNIPEFTGMLVKNLVLEKSSMGAYVSAHVIQLPLFPDLGFLLNECQVSCHFHSEHL